MAYLEEERFLILLLFIYPIASLVIGYVVYTFFKRNKKY